MAFAERSSSVCCSCISVPFNSLCEPAEMYQRTCAEGLRGGLYPQQNPPKAVFLRCHKLLQLSGFGTRDHGKVLGASYVLLVRHMTIPRGSTKL